MTEEQPNSDGLEISRRTALKATGGAIAGAGAFAGTASAHTFVFYGCSQVCSSDSGNCAVVATSSGSLECRPMDDRTNNPNRQSEPWCYEASGDEKVIGACYDSNFVPNTDANNFSNANCANRYYERNPVPSSCPCSC